jgi:hypothetical protein
MSATSSCGSSPPATVIAAVMPSAEVTKGPAEGAVRPLDADGHSGVEVGVGVDDASPALVVGDVGRDDHVGDLGQRAGPTGEHRAAPERPTWARAGDDLQPGRLGLGPCVPATARDLDQHAQPVVRALGSASAGPRGRVPGGADHDPRRGPVVGPQGCIAARP